MEWLVALFMILGLITVVGHGIWVFVAFLLRQLSGGGPRKETEITSLSLGREPRSSPARVCYSCARPLVSDGQYCTSCGRRQPERADVATGSDAKSHLLADLRVTARQLDRFRNSGAIDEATYAHLMQAVAAEQQRLAAPPTPAASPRPAPVLATPAAPTEPPVKPDTLRRVAIPARRDEHRKPPVQAPPVPATAKAEGRVSTPPARPVKDTPFAAPVAVTPRKSLAELLAAFMEEKNIRWGELVGGLLIIGCSAALVVSLWARIEQVPLLKFLIFTAMTGAFAGLGLYSEHRWKLPRTSRGLLVTATSLVPLNFLAIAAFSNASAPNSLSVVASEVISLALFFVLTDRAGAVILPGWRKPLTLGVVGTSATQLVARRFAGPDAPTAVLYLLAALPLICYWLTAALTMRRVRKHDEIEAKQADQVFTLLGVSTFSALVAFGLLLFKSQHVAWTLQRLSPAVSLFALPALFGGLVLWRRTAKLETNEEHFTSAWIAVGGAAAALAGVALGWPHPAGVLPSTLICCAAFAAVAFLFNLNAAHAAALPLFALAWLVGFNLLTGRLALWADDPALIWHALFSKSSGAALTFVFLLFVLGWEQLQRRGRERDARSYLVAAGVSAGLSLALVTLHGFAEMDVLWVYCFYAAGAFYVAWRAGRVELSVAGLGLALVALIQAVALNYGAALAHRWPVTLLAYASLALVAFAALRPLVARQGEVTRAKAAELFSRPLQHAALIASVAAALTLFRASFSATADALAATTLWLALVWLALVWLFRSALLFVPFQAALTAGVIFAVAVGLNRWQVLEESAFGAHRVKAYLVAVALLSLSWTALRIALGSVGVNPERARRLEAEEAGGAEAGWKVGGWKDVAAHVLHPAWPAFDQAALWAALAAFTLFCVGGVWPPLTGGSLSAPPPHPVSWLLFAALLVALVARLWERFSHAVVLGLVLLGALFCLLIAGTTGDAATTLRWAAAWYLMIGSCVLWLRGPLSRSAARLGWPEMRARAGGLSGAVRAALLGLTVTPLLGLTLLSAVNGEAFASLAGPLVLLCCTLIGHALREREPASAFAGGLTLNLIVTLAGVVSGGLSVFEPSGAGAVRLAQFNALACACYALLWLGARRRLAPRGSDAPPRLDALLTLQVALGLILNLTVIVPASLKLVAEPSPVAAAAAAAGSLWGWLALAAAGTAAAWAKRLEGAKLRLSAVCLGALAVSLLAASTVSRRDGGDWLSYHTLTAAGVALAFLPALILGGKRLWLDRAGVAAELGAGRWAIFINSVRPAEVASWSLGLGLFATLLGLRALFGDPQAPSWTIGTFGAMSLLSVVLAGVTLKRAYLYVACLFANAAATVWFLFRAVPATPDDGLHLLEVNLVALGALGLAFFALEKWGLAARGLKLSDDLPALHRTVAFGSLIGVAWLMVVGVANSLTAQSACGLFGSATGWLALAATAAVMTACLYDRGERRAAMGIYLLALVLTGAALDAMNVRPERFAWVSLMICASCAVVTGLLWAGRGRVEAWAALAGVPQRELPNAGAQNHWLVTAGLLLLAATMLLAFVVVLSEPQTGLRVSAAVAALAQAVTAALTARGEANEERRRRRQVLTLWLAAAGLTLAGWSWIAPGAVGGWANRPAILMVVMMAFAEFCGFRHAKLFTRSGEWAEAARRSAVWFFVYGALALAVTVSAEMAARFLPGGTRVTPAASTAVGVVLLALSARAVSFALKAGLDPLRLSERGRMTYVYAAEALLAGAYLHTRLTMPWLFSGFFQRVWPLVVMALAFVGVGLSELFRRRGQDVLAEPLARTGVFLPLLPALGYWLVDSEVHYTGVMMVVGAFYALEAVLRRSLGASLLACLAVNGGLWHLLVTWDGYGLLERPQLWLSPFAFSLLVAAHLNRERLTAAQMANLRYAALAMLYASSTAEIFIGGVADSPWQPLVLMALAAAGVACGMMLRVRAFLYLGTSFTLVAVLTMIRYAQVNFGWTWLWYVTGIALGLTIILVFALFEKKRDELMRLVESLRGWEA